MIHLEVDLLRVHSRSRRLRMRDGFVQVQLHCSLLQKAVVKQQWAPATRGGDESGSRGSAGLHHALWREIVLETCAPGAFAERMAELYS
jgi:hypothetical protein